MAKQTLKKDKVKEQAFNENDAKLGGGMGEQMTEQDPTEELLALRGRVAQLEQEKKDAEEVAGSSDNAYMKEMNDLRKAKSNGLNEIKVKEFSPKTVRLWHVSGHNVGKCVGPIDANNAEETFLRFAFFKIRLSLTRPSDAWIEKYKQTEEYKVSAEIERKRRARKNGTAKTSELDKLIRLQAKQLGIKPEDLNQIMDPTEVRGPGIAV